MPAAPVPGLDDEDHLWDDLLSPRIARVTQVATLVDEAVNASGVTPQVLARITDVENLVETSPWTWNTTVGGIREDQGGIRDDINGVYPPHPITDRMLIFNNPAKKPLANGNHITGGGELDRRLDKWVGPA